MQLIRRRFLTFSLKGQNIKYLFLPIFINLTCTTPQQPVIVPAIKDTPEPEVRLIKSDDFAKPDLSRAYAISPDASNVAYLQFYRTEMHLFLRDLETHRSQLISIPDQKNREDIIWANWLSPTQVVFILRQSSGDFLGSYDVVSKLTVPVQIVGPQGLRLQYYKQSVTSNVKGNTGSLRSLFFEAFLGNRFIADLYRLDSNKLTLVERNPGNILTWCIDQQGSLRGALALDGNQIKLMLRKTEKHPWVSVTRFALQERPLFLDYDFTGRQLFISYRKNTTETVVVRLNALNGKTINTVLQSSLVQVNRLLFSKKRKIVTGFGYDNGKLGVLITDQQRAQWQENMHLALPDQEITITSMSDDERKMVIKAYSAKNPGSYYIYEPEGNRLIKLGDARPWFNDDELSDMLPLNFSTKTNTVVTSYLLLPIQTESSEGLPFVILVNDLPWLRTTWGFHAQAQFLANRGYGVMIIGSYEDLIDSSNNGSRNFRPLTTEEISQAINAGVEKLIQLKLADPRRLCLSAKRLGTFSLFGAVIAEPERFKCAVLTSGIVNLKHYLQWLSVQSNGDKNLVGNFIGLTTEVAPVQSETKSSTHLDSNKVAAHLDLNALKRAKTEFFVYETNDTPDIFKNDMRDLVSALAIGQGKVQFKMIDSDNQMQPWQQDLDELNNLAHDLDEALRVIVPSMPE